MQLPTQTSRVRFGAFDVDLRSGELRKHGLKIKLQDQPFQVLALLLQRPGEMVSREEMRQKLWPADTFVDFDVGLNNAIKRLRDALGDTAENPRFVETVPRRGYRFIAAAETMPSPSLQDLTAHVQDSATAPRGTTPTMGKVAAHPPEASTAHRRANRWLAALLAATLGLLLVGLNAGGLRQRFLRTNAARPIQSIAVLPLENLSGDPAQEYFADGMTEELTTDLGKIAGLRVISRTSAMHYKGTRKTLPEIARELNVDAVVEGSVLRSGDRVRITAQLIEAPSDTHLFARSYERELRDVLVLQNDVARAIASEVQVKLTPQEQAGLASPHPAVNPEAYEAYLRGRSLLFSSNEKAAAYFKTAIEKDPNYAAAFAGLSYTYILRGADAFPGREAMVLAETAARKALALDETLAEAHAALGAVKYRYQWDWQGAEAEFRRAIELNPNSVEDHGSYSNYLMVLRRFPEALSEIRRVYALDPLSRGIHTRLAIDLACLRRDDEAAAEVEKALEADPQDAGALRLMGLIQLEKGQAREAIASYEQGVSVSKRSDHSLADLGYAYGVTGKRAQALQILRELETQSRRRYVSPFYTASVHLGLGNKEQALACLERAYEEHDALLVGIYYRRTFEPLYSYPQFHSLLRRMGFPPLPNSPEPR